MSDRDRTMNLHSEPTLAAALRGLPDAAPQPDLWPGLAHALARRRRRRTWRHTIPLALAAAIALALLWPQATVRQTPPPQSDAQIAAVTTATTEGRRDADELTALHGRSRALERWVAAVAAHAPQDSRDLMAAVEVEDLIGLVDVQLGAVRANAEALPLWRQRVALLEDLATIRGNAYAIAANDDGTIRNARFPVRLN